MSAVWVPREVGSEMEIAGLLFTAGGIAYVEGKEQKRVEEETELRCSPNNLPQQPRGTSALG